MFILQRYLINLITVTVKVTWSNAWPRPKEVFEVICMYCYFERPNEQESRELGNELCVTYGQI